jgi:trehalose-6-phosphate synthase
VNPYETDNVVDVLNRALLMSLDERKLRMNQLKKRERRMDVDAWVKGFLEGMNQIEGGQFKNKVLRMNNLYMAKLHFQKSLLQARAAPSQP